jgi:hypothetical protein
LQIPTNHIQTAWFKHCCNLLIYLPARDADHGEGNSDHTSNRTTSIWTKEEIHTIQFSARILKNMHKLFLNRKKDVSERRKTPAKNPRH